MQFYPISQSGRFDIDPIPLSQLEVGDYVSLDLNGFLTAGAPGVVWSLDGGALPPGVNLSADGRLTGTVAGLGGTYVVQVKADAGALGVAVQAMAFSVPREDTGGGAPSYGFAAGGDEKEWTEATSGRQMRGHAFLVSGTVNVTKAGVYRTVRIGGGGPGATANPGGGGSGGEVIDRWEWLEPGSYPVVVGAGGSPGSPGTATTFNGLSALGGKNAAGNAGAASSTGTHTGGSGDSYFGGGGAGCSSWGGSGAGNSSVGRAGGGGGGVALTVLDMPLLLGGGGGGGKRNSGVNGDGRHGGGNGAAWQSRASAGAPNTGGGGGGGGQAGSTGGNGGSGSFYIEYQVG